MWFIVTSDRLDGLAGRSERVDRNNIHKLRVDLDSEIELKDRQYLLVINFGETDINFTVSGELEPPPPPKPEPVPEPEPIPEPTLVEPAEPDVVVDPPVDDNKDETEEESKDDTTDSEDNNTDTTE